MGRFLTRRKMLVAGAGAAAATPALLAGRASVAAQTSTRTGPTHVELAPQRIYDSRRPDSLMGGARLESGESLLIHAGIPEGFDFTLGVFVNCTITDTIGAGWLTLFAFLAESPAPGTSNIPQTSNINWSTSGQTLANLALCPVGSEHSIEVLCDGGGATHFILDRQGHVVVTPT